LEDNSEIKEIDFKEKRIRELTSLYYNLKDVKNAIFDFSKNRECIPRYYEVFGKRPDNFQYKEDISEQVKKGATSFHCSEELWKDPLEISNNMSDEDIKELKIGWDLILDIDSPYLEYSKIYADLLIKTLEFYGIKNIGVKYSGNRGFHIIIPWKAFPEEIYGNKTKDMFPEWPRLICEYLSYLIKPKLEESIFEESNIKDLSRKTGKKEEELIIRECKSCGRPSEKSFLITWFCKYCKNKITTKEETYNNRKKSKCPECRKELIEIDKKEIYVCNFCSKNSSQNPELFEEKERFATERLIDADLILVSSRHLFRMPYSLHEKTSLSSIVIDKNNIKNFQITDANPLKVEIRDYYPKPTPDEARELLLQALDWKEQKQKKENETKTEKKKIRENFKDKNFDNRKIEIKNPNENIFPPCMKLLLSGIKNDGRKRALFLLINFFKSLGISDEELERRISEWNKKNYKPLEEGYIKSQLIWYRKKGAILPPNCDKPNYAALGVCKPDALCRAIKNPVNYAIKKYFHGNK